MCIHCQTQTHTEPQSPEPSETPAQIEDRIDKSLCRHWASLRGVPGGHTLGDFRDDSLSNHRPLRDFLGGLWKHWDVVRKPRIEPSDIERIWEQSFQRGDGSTVPRPRQILRPNFSHTLWTQKVSAQPREIPSEDFPGVWTTERYDLPSPPLSIAGGQRIFRPILKTVKRWEHTTPELQEVWERFSEKMGQFWGRDSEVWGVSVSCAPSAFLGLGHYGEYNSCYRAGGQYAQAPWALGCLPRSVVILIYRGEYDTPQYGPRLTPPSGRLWGQWGSEDFPGIVGTNLYKLGWDVVRPLLTDIVSQFWGSPRETVETFEPYSSLVAPGLHSEHVYFNGDDLALTPDPRGLESYLQTQTSWDAEKWGECSCHSCACCGDQYDPDYEGGYCEGCGQGVCDYCGTYFSSGYFYCENCATPVHCDHCGETYPEEDTVECEGCGNRVCEDCSVSCGECGESLCPDCVSECEECGEYLCSECSVSCEECGAEHCPDCLSECDGCGDRVCGNCEEEHREETCPQGSLQGVI